MLNDGKPLTIDVDGLQEESRNAESENYQENNRNKQLDDAFGLGVEIQLPN